MPYLFTTLSVAFSIKHFPTIFEFAKFSLLTLAGVTFDKKKTIVLISGQSRILSCVYTHTISLVYHHFELINPKIILNYRKLAHCLWIIWKYKEKNWLKWNSSSSIIVYWTFSKNILCLSAGDTSGQSEPLLSSFDDPGTAISINSRQTGNLTEDEEQNLITPGPDTPLLINYEVICWL